MGGIRSQNIEKQPKFLKLRINVGINIGEWIVKLSNEKNKINDVFEHSSPRVPNSSYTNGLVVSTT